MARRDTIFTSALCVSLIAHGLGLSALGWWFVAHTPPPKLAALDKVKILLAAMPNREFPVPPPAEVPPQPKPRLPALPTVKAPIKFEKPPPDDRDDSGEADGKGRANRSTDGKTPMRANAGPVQQADLMKEAKKFAEEAFLPASAGAATPNDAVPSRSSARGLNMPDTVAKSNDAKLASPADVKPETGVGPQPVKPEPAARPTAGTAMPPPKASVAQAPAPKAVEKEIVGHRATQSDTESVAFATTEGGSFTPGKLDARQGVKVKWVEPRFGLASQHDFELVGDAPTVFYVPIDSDGNPDDVLVQQSSGSDNIDQDRKLAVWKSVFSPKDKDGHPIDHWIIKCQ